MRTMTLLAATLLALAVPPAIADTFAPRLGIVRIAPGDKAPLVASAHFFAGGGPSAGIVTSGVTTFFQAEGSSPVRFACATSIGGDGASDLVVVREKLKKGSRLDLRVVSIPVKGFDKKPTLLASATDLGFAIGDGRVVAICAFAFDDVPGDELAIVRAHDDGTQSLEIRGLPTGKKQTLAPSLASDATFGLLDLDEVVAISRIDVAGATSAPSAPRLAVLRRVEGEDTVEIVAPPATPDGESGPPVASYVSVEVADGANGIGLSTLDGDLDGAADLLIVREDADGERRLERLPVPTTNGQVAPTPSIVGLGAALGTTGQLFTAFATGANIPSPPPPPPPPLVWNGPWRLLVGEQDPLACGLEAVCGGGPAGYSAPGGGGGGGLSGPPAGSAPIGAFKGFTGNMNVFSVLNLSLPTVLTAKGKITLIANPTGTQVGTCAWVVAPPAPGLAISVKVPNGVNGAAIGQVVKGTLGAGVVEQFGDGTITIRGPLTGSLFASDGVTAIHPLQEYVFVNR